MTWIDLVIIVVILLSTFVSLVRGFAREALSLVGWIVAFWVALTFMTRFAQLWVDVIVDPTFRLITAFAILFVLTLLVSIVVNFFVNQIIKRTGLTNLDRFAGVLFGFLRGIVLVSVVVLLLGLTPVPRAAWWQESLLMGNFEAVAMWMTEFLPRDVAAGFKY